MAVVGWGRLPGVRCAKWSLWMTPVTSIMPKMRPSKKRAKRHKLDNLKTKPLRDHDQKRVKGGKTPSPGGPVPIPYPNVAEKGS